MVDLPEGLEHGRHAELDRRNLEPWARRAFLGLLLVAVVAALIGLAGQRASTTGASGASARLQVRVPEIVRGGLLFQARIRVTAVRDIEKPRLVLSEGWADGLQINTVAPGPDAEWNRDGRLSLEYDKSLPAGHTMTVYIQFQVDPTSVGRTKNDIEIHDGDTPLAAVHRTLRRLP